RQRPAFALVRERRLRGKRLRVVDERDLVRPRELEEIVVPERDAFAEVLTTEVALLHDLAGVDLHLANRRLAVEPGAFVQKPVTIFETLGERLRIVRVTADDRV